MYYRRQDFDMQRVKLTWWADAAKWQNDNSSTTITYWFETPFVSNINQAYFSNVQSDPAMPILLSFLTLYSTTVSNQIRQYIAVVSTYINLLSLPITDVKPQWFSLIDQSLHKEQPIRRTWYGAACGILPTRKGKKSFCCLLIFTGGWWWKT